MLCQPGTTLLSCPPFRSDNDDIRSRSSFDSGSALDLYLAFPNSPEILEQLIQNLFKPGYGVDEERPDGIVVVIGSA